jgi:drug/metabolite transporter (DMT)-like permease
MKNSLFYLATILIWGSTWIGIKMQLGQVDPMVSVAYRFSLAAVILLAWCSFRGLTMRFSLSQHGFMMLQGILLFGFNYLFFYIAELYLTSGLAAVIFSTILVMNIVNGAIFLGNPFDKRVLAGGVIGLIGIILVFQPEIAAVALVKNSIFGILICVSATLLASLGNITSARNQKKGLPIIQTNAYGMAYGALAMLLVAVLFGRDFTFEFTTAYVSSLLYLAVFGSIIAFGCYLTLIGSIGADRAAYATLLFPIVALAISTIWEGYRWTPAAVLGVALILTGNLSILKKGQKGGSAAVIQMLRRIGLIIGFRGKRPEQSATKL